MAYRDKEKLRAYQAKFHREYRRKYPKRHAAYEAKRDKAARAAARRKARAEGREDHKAVLRRSYRKHKRKRLDEMKAWRAANKELWLLYMRAFKAKRRQLIIEGKFTVADIRQLFRDQEGACKGCDVELANGYHVDHIIPIARGGSNWPSNLQLLCGPCNRSKGKKTMAEWLSI